MTEKEAYLVLQAASGLKVGDTVKVLRRAKRYEMGWNNGWDEKEMNDMIGNEYEIENINLYGIQLISKTKECRRFPFFVLEKISDAKPVDPIIDFIEKNNFGCSEQKQLTKELVQMILDKMRV